MVPGKSETSQNWASIALMTHGGWTLNPSSSGISSNYAPDPPDIYPTSHFGPPDADVEFISIPQPDMVSPSHFWPTTDAPLPPWPNMDAPYASWLVTSILPHTSHISSSMLLEGS